MIQLIKSFFIKRRRVKIAKLVLKHKYLNQDDFSGGICTILANLQGSYIINCKAEVEFKQDLFRFYIFAYGGYLQKLHHPFWFSLDEEGDEERKDLLKDYIKYNKQNKTY